MKMKAHVYTWAAGWCVFEQRPTEVESNAEEYSGDRQCAKRAVHYCPTCAPIIRDHLEAAGLLLPTAGVVAKPVPPLDVDPPWEMEKREELADLQGTINGAPISIEVKSK